MNFPDARKFPIPKDVKFALVATFIVWLLVFPACAEILIEPYVGYANGSQVTAFTRDGSIKYAGMGPTYGARLGYEFSHLTFAIDGSADSQNLKMTEDSCASLNGDSEVTASGSRIGLATALSFKGLRILVTYDFKNQLIIKTSASEQTFKGSSGYKIGISFLRLPIVVVNFEMSKSVFNEYTDSSGGSGLGTDFARESASASSYVITLSIPWSPMGFHGYSSPTGFNPHVIKK